MPVPVEKTILRVWRIGFYAIARRHCNLNDLGPSLSPERLSPNEFFNFLDSRALGAGISDLCEFPTEIIGFALRLRYAQLSRETSCLVRA